MMSFTEEAKDSMAGLRNFATEVKKSIVGLRKTKSVDMVLLGIAAASLSFAGVAVVYLVASL